MGTVLPMIMDVLIIVLLGGTIFYAARLSFHIKAFRDSRAEMESLLGNLSMQINKAESAIEGLRENARESGRDLQQVINEAHALNEELQIMTQSGERLAGRLEQIHDKQPRQQAPRKKTLEELLAATPKVEKTPLKPKEKPVEKNAPEPFAGFAIRDPEFDRDVDGEMDEDGLMAGDYEDDAENSFGSRAEKELYEALQRNKTKAGAGGV